MKIRLWHFIALPTLGMGVMILLGRLIGSAVDDRFGPAGDETYVAIRSIVTTLVMVALIAWLAFAYRRGRHRGASLRLTANGPRLHWHDAVESERAARPAYRSVD